MQSFSIRGSSSINWSTIKDLQRYPFLQTIIMAGGVIVPSDGRQYSGKMTSYVFFACILAASGGAIFGYDIGISGDVVLNFLCTHLSFIS